MRRTVVLIVAVVTLMPASLLAGADSSLPWEFDGGGWGHGLGLSQYGSQGMALDGYTYHEIIDHYFSGADVKHLNTIGAEAWLYDPEALWVGMYQNQVVQTFEAIGNDIDVCQTGDGTDTCDTPDETLTDGQTLTVMVSGTDPLECERSVDGGEATAGDCWIDVTWDEDPQNRRVETGTLQFARGTLRLRPNLVTDPDKFHISVSVDLEKYIYGIAETLLHWHDETLKTQAVIARSYGVANALTAANGSGDLWTSSKNDCWCHIGSTAASQNYDAWSGGLATEGDPTNGADWRNAVDATEFEIVTHPSIGSGNTIISTFYSSSNGGWSENNEDVWGGAPQPHLRSVEDPWSADPNLNPLANWTVFVSDDDMATALGWDRVLDAFVLEGPPGLQVRFTGKDGGSNVEAILDGTDIRTILNIYGYREGGLAVRVSPYITTVTDPPGFDDIVGHLFEGDIEWAAEEGITKGCNPPANTLFCPDDPVSREVMAAFINRALDLPAASQDYFTDDDGSIFEDDINRMAEAGITTGCGGPLFCPKDIVDRGQMAAFIVRALGLTDNGGGDLFIDDDNSIFENDIDRLATADITRGCNPPTNNKYCPDLDVTRGAMTAFLHRALGP